MIKPFEYTPTYEDLEEALKECARLSGADLSDGFPTYPPLHEFVVQEVYQLRQNYDDLCDETYGVER